MADYDLLIIGAGISGLSVAHYAVQAGLNALVLEQNHRVGGCLHSHRFTGAFAGFWLELGAHSCFNSYGNLLAILESARALDRLQARAKVRFRLFTDGTVRTIPSQLSISELLQAPFRLIGWQKSGRSVAEYFGRIVGPRNYAAVFGPAFDAVICQPAGLFPADCLFRSRRRRKNIPRGFTFSDGLQTVADVLATQPGIRIERGRAAREIRRVGEEFVVRTDQCDYSARHLCVATPVEVAARLLRAELPALADRLAENSNRRSGNGRGRAADSAAELAATGGTDRAERSILFGSDPRYRAKLCLSRLHFSLPSGTAGRGKENHAHC